MKVFILLKHEAFKKEKIGEVIFSYQKLGWNIVNLTFYENPSKETLETYYEKFSAKEGFQKLIETISEGPVICLVLEKSTGSNEGAVRFSCALRQYEFDDYIILNNSSRCVFCDSKIALDRPRRNWSLPGNFINCTGTQEETDRAIDLWFK